MRAITKRTAAFSAAIAGVALIGAGCQQAKDKAGQAMNSLTSSASSAPAAPSATTSENAPSSTQIAGANGTEYTVQGPILEKYNALEQAAKTDLGKPTGNEETTPDGGVFQQFEGGVIVHQTQSYVVWGKIRDKWNELGGSQGKLGYPTSDETDAANGAKKQTFQHGTVTWKPGDAEATVAEQ